MHQLTSTFKRSFQKSFFWLPTAFPWRIPVEARVPLLDHTLVETAFQVPPELRTNSRDPENLLTKAIASRWLPEELINAPKKGFVLPLAEWTRHELRPMIEDLLSPERLRRQGLFSKSLWEDILLPHWQGKQDLSAQVWTLFMFQLWAKVFIEGDLNAHHAL